MVQPWEDPIAKATQGFLGGFQMARNAQMQNQQVEQQKKQQEFDDDVKTYNVLMDHFDQAKKAGAGQSYLSEIFGQVNDYANKIASRGGIKMPKWDGKFDPQDYSLAKSLRDILNSPMPLDEAKRAFESKIAELTSTGAPKTVVDQMKEQAAQSIYSDIKSSPDMGGEWRLKREGMLSAIDPSGLGKQLGQEQQTSRLGMLAGELGSKSLPKDQEGYLKQAYLEMGGKPSDIKDMAGEYKSAKPDGLDPVTREPVYWNPNEKRYKNVNTDEPVTIKGRLIPLGGKTLGAEDVNSLSISQELVGDLNSVLSSAYNSYTGPLTGRAKAVSSKLKDDPAFVDLASKVERQIMLVYATSGKQVADKELERWQKILAQVYDPSGNFESKIRSVGDYVTRLYNRKVENFGKAGYDVSGFGSLQPFNPKPVYKESSTGGSIAPKTKGMKLTDESIVAQYLKLSGGDTKKAQSMALKDGWRF